MKEEKPIINNIFNIKDENGEDLDLGNTNADVYIKFSQSPQDPKFALVRTVGIK